MSSSSSSSSESDTDSESESESESETSDSESESDSDESSRPTLWKPPKVHVRAAPSVPPKPQPYVCHRRVLFDKMTVSLLVQLLFLPGMVNRKHDHEIYDDDSSDYTSATMPVCPRVDQSLVQTP